MRSTLRTSRRTARQAAQKGAFAQATGASRGGRTVKLLGLAGPQGRLRLLMLSAGNINDMTTASSLLEQARGRFDRRGYDTNAFEAPLWNRRRRGPVP